jgi:hypothetical protein
MGLKEAKGMIITIAVILFITNIFSSQIVGLDSLGTYTDEKLGNLYDTETGQLTGDGRELNNWANTGDTDIEDDATAFDFLFSSWTWIKNGVVSIFNFLYAPYVLTDLFVNDQGSSLTFLWWLPALIGLIWTIALTFTVMQILWKE